MCSPEKRRRTACSTGPLLVARFPCWGFGLAPSQEPGRLPGGGVVVGRCWRVGWLAGAVERLLVEQRHDASCSKESLAAAGAMFELLHTSMLFDPATFGVGRTTIFDPVVWSIDSRLASGFMRSQRNWAVMESCGGGARAHAVCRMVGGGPGASMAERLPVGLFVRAGPAEGYQGTLMQLSC